MTTFTASRKIENTDLDTLNTSDYDVCAWHMIVEEDGTVSSDGSIEVDIHGENLDSVVDNVLYDMYKHNGGDYEVESITGEADWLVVTIVGSYVDFDSFGNDFKRKDMIQIEATRNN